MNEFRQDAITGRWAIVAESRAARPSEYARPPAPESSQNCPFCAGNESSTPPEVAVYRTKGSKADGPGWSVRTIPNKFPTLSPVPSHEPGSPASVEPRRPGYGFHEVIIESPSHSAGLSSLPAGQVREFFWMLRERIRDISSRPGIRAVVAFENSGPESGGTLFHPHAQIVALPEVPPLLADESKGASRFARTHGGVCAFEAELAREREVGQRIVWDTPEMVVYAPFASAHPYEVRFVPTRHAPSLAAATELEIDRLVEGVPRALRALEGLVPGASYNFVSRSFASGAGEESTYHWHFDLLPRLIRPDGFEIGSGIPVNPVPPESAAGELRWSSEAKGHEPGGESSHPV